MKYLIEVVKLAVELAILGVAIYGIGIASQEFQKHTAAFNFAAFAQINEAYNDILWKYAEANDSQSEIVLSPFDPVSEREFLRAISQKHLFLGSLMVLNSYVKELIDKGIIDSTVSAILEDNQISQTKAHVCGEICLWREDDMDFGLTISDVISGFDRGMKEHYGLDCICPD